MPLPELHSSQLHLLLLLPACSVPGARLRGYTVFPQLRKGTMLFETILKRRAAVESWKLRNREYYLAQKRAIASRPANLEKRRERYRVKREAFIREHGLPKRGRPRSSNRDTNPLLRKYDFETGSEIGDRFCDLSECCPKEQQDWSWPCAADPWGQAEDPLQSEGHHKSRGVLL